MPIFIQSGRFGFNPLSLSPAFWFDADDAASLSIDGSTNVSQWNDKSGNGRHVSQATSTSRPAYTAAGQNGRPVLTFDGTDDRLTSAAVTIAQPLTLFVVLKNAANTATQRSVFGSTSNAPILYKQLTNQYWSAWGGSALGSTTPADLNAHQLTAVYNNTSSSIRLDGASIASGTLGANGYSAEVFSIGKSTIGSGSDYWLGTVAEMIGYGTLSTTDRDLVEAYLKAKWGTP